MTQQLINLFTAISLGFSAMAMGQPTDDIEIFDIRSEPSKADWRYFHQKLSSAQKETLWRYHAQRGKSLDDWNWGWRLAWVRFCGATHKRSLSQQILFRALSDNALVVRAEAADQLGKAYEDSGDQKIVDLLQGAFKDRRNQRNGKPMYIQKRILYALKRIGGSHALQAGASLARTHKTSQSYWKKLNRM